MCECCTDYFEKRRFQRITVDDFESFDVSMMSNDDLKYFVKTFRQAHQDDTSFNLSRWNVEHITNMSYLFYRIGIEFVDVTGWNTRNVESMNSMFAGAANLEAVNGLNTWNVENVKDVSEMFHGCKMLHSLDMYGWNLKNCETSALMFQDCENLVHINLDYWNVNNIRNMNCMFRNCRVLTNLRTKGWQVNSLTSCTSMMDKCPADIFITMTGPVTTR